MKVIKSEMAGTLLEMKVKVGDVLKDGQEVALMESMKMEVGVKSPLSGKVTKVCKSNGDFVNEGEALLEVE